MSAQPDVAERQRRLIQPDRLTSLARQVRRLTDEGPPTATLTGIEALVIRARLHAVRPRLLAVADALECGESADPVAVARLWTLLRLGIANPLYARTLTTAQLEVILRQALYRMTVDGRPVAHTPRRSMSTADDPYRTTDTP